MPETKLESFSNPQPFIWRMFFFLLIIGSVCILIYPRLYFFFIANPGLNGLITGILIVGIGFTFRMVIRLFPEIRWISGFRVADPGLEVHHVPVLLAPMAIMLRERKGEMILTMPAMRSILDSIATRLDESREISRYLIGSLAFLGLLGTFWGLLDTITAVKNAIMSLNTESPDTHTFFNELKHGLVSPISGMGTAFSSSLFGIGGSIILGFMDLQAGQAQNRFYTNLEDWLSTVTNLSPDEERHAGRHASPDTMNGSTNSGEDTLRIMASVMNLAASTQSIARNIENVQLSLHKWLHASQSTQIEIKMILETMTHKLSDLKKED